MSIMFSKIYLSRFLRIISKIDINAFVISIDKHSEMRNKQGGFDKYPSQNKYHSSNIDLQKMRKL